MLNPASRDEEYISREGARARARTRPSVRLIPRNCLVPVWKD